MKEQNHALLVFLGLMAPLAAVNAAPTNVALNAPVTIVQKDPDPNATILNNTGANLSKITDGQLLPVGTNYSSAATSTFEWSGALWTFQITLNGTYTIDSLQMEADDNDTYYLEYLNLSNNTWTPLYTGPIVSEGVGLAMRPSEYDITAQYALPTPITTNAVRFYGGQSNDNLCFDATCGQGGYSVRQILLFGVPATLHAGSVARGVQTDYLGEGKASFTVWRPSQGDWYSADALGVMSTDTTTHASTTQWGSPSDLPVIGDFDGDGKSDVAVFRPSTGYWYITQSSNGAVVAKQWGLSTDTPVAGDFDGDGKTDLAVFRASNGYWYVTQSSNGTIVSKQWGESGDTPVVGDFDGDGKSDVAVFRPSTGYWYVVHSSNGAIVAKQWGALGDIPVTGDFDGDGKTDIAVYRPSTGYWYVIQSSSGQVVSTQWGEAGDLPVARDYDGDGKTDIAVFRPSTGSWYVIQSSNGAVVSVMYGVSTDVPVNNLTR